jgi:excisionase family DNA binding protein
MELQGTRVIDISVTELSKLIEQGVTRVLDARLPKADPKYYTVQDVAKILTCSKVWLYKLINEGHIDYKRMKGTRKIRFTQEDIDNFFKVNPGYKPGKIRRKNQESSPISSGV